MICYKVTHKYRLDDHMERKDIGIYSTHENACAAVAQLKDKPGFCDTQDGFRIRRVLRVGRPRLLDVIGWAEGFDTYTYYPGLDHNEQRTLELVKEYGFDFENIPKQEIVHLLEQELQSPWPGSAEYLRVLCGYLYCLGDASDVPLLEKAKYSVNMDAGSMIDAEWIDSLKNGGQADRDNHIRTREEIVRDFIQYYKEF